MTTQDNRVFILWEFVDPDETSLSTAPMFSAIRVMFYREDHRLTDATPFMTTTSELQSIEHQIAEIGAVPRLIGPISLDPRTLANYIESGHLGAEPQHESPDHKFILICAAIAFIAAMLTRIYLNGH